VVIKKGEYTVGAREAKSGYVGNKAADTILCISKQGIRITGEKGVVLRGMLILQVIHAHRVPGYLDSSMIRTTQLYYRRCIGCNLTSGHLTRFRFYQEGSSGCIEGCWMVDTGHCCMKVYGGNWQVRCPRVRHFRARPSFYPSLLQREPSLFCSMVCTQVNNCYLQCGHASSLAAFKDSRLTLTNCRLSISDLWCHPCDVYLN
jgi:hypothetical protein